MLTTFEPRRPVPHPRREGWPSAIMREHRAAECESKGDWSGAATQWREACDWWRKAGDRAMAEWALSQAGRCELELDPEYQRLKAEGQVKIVRLGGRADAPSEVKTGAGIDVSTAPSASPPTSGAAAAVG